MRQQTAGILAFTFVLFAGACRKSETPAASQAPGQQTQTAAAPAPAEAPAAEAATAVGSAMPAYSAKWFDGTTFDLQSKKGSVVLLNLWATWCGPCRYEIPELQKLHDAHRAKGFEVIGVSVDEGDPEEVRKFVAEKKVTYPIALDPEGKLANLLQTSVLPTSVLVDRKGNIVWKHFGAVFENDPDLAKAIAAAL